MEKPAMIIMNPPTIAIIAAGDGLCIGWDVLNGAGIGRFAVGTDSVTGAGCVTIVGTGADWGSVAKGTCLGGAVVIACGDGGNLAGDFAGAGTGAGGGTVATGGG